MDSLTEKLIEALRKNDTEVVALPKGLVVIDAAEGKNGKFIIGKWRGEFVTWEVVNNEHVISGNYFVDILDAAKDYKKRLNS